MVADEQFCEEIAFEASEAGKDKGLKPTEVANVLVQSAMLVLEQNPPSDHKVRPMWLADSIAGIRSTLDSRVQSVVGAAELFQGSMSPLTIAVISAMVERFGGEVSITKGELASEYDLRWSLKSGSIDFTTQRRIDNPQGRKEGQA